MPALRKSIVLGAAAAAVAVAALFAVADDKPAGELAVGKPAPAFTATTMAGKELKFPEAYKGKVVLVDFWATWCPPCRKEIPHLVEAHAKFHERGLEILSISLDEPRRVSAEKVTDFVSKNKMAWAQIYADVQPISRQFNIQFIPSAFLVKGDTGEMLAMGDDLRGDALHATIEKHLAPAKP